MKQNLLMVIVCNVSKKDRIYRGVLGLTLIFASIFYTGTNFYLVLGTVITLTGIFGYCGLYKILTKLKIK